MRPMASKILIVIKSPPYSNRMAAEGFRVATAMIAMDVLPKLLFIEDGIYCLIRNQKPEAAGLESFVERLKTLADLVGLYVASDSLRNRRLKPSDLDENYNAKILSLREASNLVSENESIITF